MIRSSACPLRQADPAQFGRHGDRISYTTSRDIIVTDHEWSMITPCFRTSFAVCPCVDDCRVLNCILWRFRTGSPWAKIPERYGTPTTCYSRFFRWHKAGVRDRLPEEISKV